MPHFKKWNCSFTEKNRYKNMGVEDLAEAFIKIRKIGTPKILDVGCSNGKAMKSLKELLRKSGINSYLVGIDINKKILKDAKRVFNRVFIGDILKNNNLDKARIKFDVVICSRVGIFVGHKIRASIINRCADLVKPNGCLITDIDAYDKFSKIKFSKEVVTSNKLGNHNFVMLVGSNTIRKHATSILDNWNNLPWYKKTYHNFDVLYHHFLRKIGFYSI